ncbi:MAG: quinolinate synthase NadA, partial [Bacteroidota bacterium]
AHYYQDSDIQDIADFIGDSLGLAQQAEKTTADIIAFAGVHFMAETAKLLNPDKKVVLPDLRAGCSLADSCPPQKFREFLNMHPDYIVISYINCTAEIKAMSDIICTSSNAVKVVESVAADKKIIFAPDKNLGAYVIKKTGRDMLLWNGTCMVHEIFSLEKITKLKNRHPDAEVIAHPECEEIVLKQADFIGSTTALLKYSQTSPKKEFIVATESGIIYQMQKASPEKVFIPAPPDNSCACNDCPHMKLNTLEKLYLCLKNELPEVIIPKEIAERALLPLKRMLEISARG